MSLSPLRAGDVEHPLSFSSRIPDGHEVDAGILEHGKIYPGRQLQFTDPSLEYVLRSKTDSSLRMTSGWEIGMRRVISASWNPTSGKNGQTWGTPA